MKQGKFFRFYGQPATVIAGFAESVLGLSKGQYRIVKASCSVNFMPFGNVQELRVPITLEPTPAMLEQYGRIACSDPNVVGEVVVRKPGDPAFRAESF